MSATVYLTPGANGTTDSADRLAPLDGRGMLSWREIREMHRAGIVFGAHTLTHPDLTRLPLSAMEVEVLRSKAIIEEALGTSVDCFAYPLGRYDERSRDLVRRYFACACSNRLGLITTGSDVYALKRVDAYYLRRGWGFDLMLTPLFPWYIRARAVPRGVRRALVTQ